MTAEDTTEVTTEVAPEVLGHRCIACLRPLPKGNHCAACEKAHRCFVSERGADLPHVGNHHPSTPRSDRQFHGDHYQP